MRTFPQFTRDFLEFELPLDQAWCYYAWAQANDPIAQLSGVGMASKGYIAQEIERLIEEKKAERCQP